MSWRDTIWISGGGTPLSILHTCDNDLLKWGLFTYCRHRQPSAKGMHKEIKIKNSAAGNLASETGEPEGKREMVAEEEKTAEGEGERATWQGELAASLQTRENRVASGERTGR